MNRTMPPGDCGNRGRPSRRAPRCAGAVSRAIGLLSRIEDHSEERSLIPIQENR
jgi:hypothetical protein